jgi:SAM-dependent methyltransferase
MSKFNELQASVLRKVKLRLRRAVADDIDRAVQTARSECNAAFELRLSALDRQVRLGEKYAMAGFWRALDRAYDLSLPHRQIRCIVCGYEAKRDGYEIRIDQCFVGGGKLERYGCPKCDAVFGPMKYLDLDPEFVGQDYELIYTRHQEADLTEVEVHAFHECAPRRDGVYLNWGCGSWSKSVSTLRREAWNVFGFEPFAETGDPAIIKSKSALPAPLDGIFSNNVIEHFIDPVAQFKEFHSLLKPGGRMVHSSPCYAWSYAYTRFHTFFPLGRSADVLAEQTGFRVVGRGGCGQYLSAVFERVEP